MGFKKKKEKQEAFLGTFRCNADTATLDFLKPIMPISRHIKEGIVFYRYADNHLEVGGTVAELMDAMSKEIMERDRNGRNK